VICELSIKRCEGKKALITGGGSGIGRAIALALAREGANVALLDVNIEKASEVAKEFESLGKDSIALKVDVSDGSEVEFAINKVLAAWGRIDILVNNAGICRVASIEDTTEADWDLVMAVNLKGTFLCSRAVMKVMKKQKSGKIINFGSVSGKVGGIAAGAHYSASKAGVMCFTKSLARELAPFGINVNGIAPGVIETDMTRSITGGDWDKYISTIPLGRIGTQEEVDKLALFLASEDADYLTGEIVDINGGQFMD